MASSKKTVRGRAKATIDHDEIRNWVESHGGQPSSVAGTRGAKGPGILRIDFPGFSGEGKLKPISWDEFFERFEEANLAFLYQDAAASGRPSRFNKLVGRETIDLASSRKKAPARRATKARRATNSEPSRASKSRPSKRSRVVEAPSAPTARAARTARTPSKKARSKASSSARTTRAARTPSKKARSRSRSPNRQ
jgi:hypothetical protein